MRLLNHVKFGQKLALSTGTHVNGHSWKLVKDNFFVLNHCLEEINSFSFESFWRRSSLPNKRTTFLASKHRKTMFYSRQLFEIPQSFS